MSSAVLRGHASLTRFGQLGHAFADQFVDFLLGQVQVVAIFFRPNATQQKDQQ
jgi:hypothetical protein